MTLHQARIYFESLIAQDPKRSALKVYQEFVRIISNLESRDLTAADIRAIEEALERIDLTPTAQHSQKYMRKALVQFKAFLKANFSLIPNGYYAKLGLGLGSTFGLLFGIVFLSNMERSIGIALGISFGMLLGLIIGQKMDADAKEADKIV